MAKLRPYFWWDPLSQPAREFWGYESAEGTRNEKSYQGHPDYYLSFLEHKASGNTELVKLKGQNHSRILPHLIVALSIESRLYLFTNFLAFHCYSDLPVAADCFTVIA